MYQRILVATDGSELSNKAVDHAVRLAATCGAELLAATVIPVYPRGYYDGSLALHEDEIARIKQSWADIGRKHLDVVRDAAAAHKVKVTEVMAESDLVSDALLELAAKHKADLIVMASHGRRGMSRLLLGSETQHVVTHAKIPVLVLH
ncbi:MAG: universal stress protein [Burkholderiales bacterium]|uniref:Universal stress protein n=1 Tax=Ottowia pentelensis TaxID=511108 RepID=A0ABV6PVW2_9BURK|nr:universal stress protein [Ottowia sp.]MBN9404391.1 universal stress protein [Burkholderiales bacterium]MBS0403702.1 universal stress protein [Pseudomonadota bacterium]HMN55968.1 universal stress protein [Ottowia sp.]